MKPNFSIALAVTIVLSFGFHPLPVQGEEAKSAVAPDSAPSPEVYLQRPVGADFHLADWKAVSGYYRLLAEKTATVNLLQVGETTEGRDFLAAVISSPQNLASLDEIKAASRIIADPRGATLEQRQQAIDQGKVILFITPTMHSDEPAATEMGMQLSWLLATSAAEPWRSMREEAVTVILPSLNPDGVDHVAHWYAKNLGKPYEASELPELYQKYTGHDNNRDFFALTQVESRLLTKLMYHDWQPQILWDVHQHGASGERFFVPPYRDPLNGNIDPLIVAGINVIGARATMDMTAEKCTGVSSGVSYGNWWNGGNRSVPARHNVIGILTEAASANLASPMFLKRSQLKDPVGRSEYAASNKFIDPWPGGWWRVSDIIRYELSFAESLMGTISREPKFWLANKMAAADKACDLGDDPQRHGWLITMDNQDLGAVRRLVDILLLSGVEVHESPSTLQADGRSYPAGTLVVRSDQPNRNVVDDLFELKEFPAGETSYDVSGWSLPALFGLRVVEVVRPLEGEMVLLTPSDTVPKAFAAYDEKKALELKDSRDWTRLIRRLQKGDSTNVVVTEQVGVKNEAAIVDDDIEQSQGLAEPQLSALRKLPRVGVYAPWNASIDEGWLRWTLDYLELPYTRVRNEMVRAGKLKDDFDVMLIPDISATGIENGRREGSVEAALAGGLDVEGALAIEEFVRDGGKLIVMDSACPWVIDLFRLPLLNVTKEPQGKGFACSGSVLRGVVQADPQTSGLPETTPLMFANSAAWRIADTKEIEAGDFDDCDIVPLLRYAPRRVLLSGVIEKPEVIQNQIAWARVTQGAGTIHLFGFRPYYRGWSHATFHLLMRSILVD